MNTSPSRLPMFRCQVLTEARRTLGLLRSHRERLVREIKELEGFVSREAAKGPLAQGGPPTKPKL